MLPLVSCLCVSRGNFDLPIRCFEQQTYPKRELVIVQGAPWPDKLPEVPGVRFIRHDKDVLGAVRNFGVAKTKGEYIIIWDDDDWHAPERIDEQFEKLEVSEASILKQVVLIDTVKKQAYLSGHRRWEGTLMANRKKLEQNPYSTTQRGSDTPVLVKLNECGGINPVNRNDLYGYVIHGQNNWDRSHYEYFFYEAELLDEFDTSEWLERVSL